MRLASRSVRARLTLWHAGVLALVICVFAAGILLFVRARLYRELDARIDQDLATIEKVYREETGDLGELAHRMDIVLFEVREGETVIYRTAGWPPAGTTRYRMKTTGDAVHRVSAAREETALRQTLGTLATILALGIPCAIGLALAGGYLLAGRVLAPVGAMAETARRITVESLDARLPVEHPQDEFGRLAGVFNDTLSRLAAAFEQLRRFTADASHELRTPLTGMRSVGEVALQRPLSPEGYREAIGSMLEDVDRLTRLVESLLLLTRAEAGRIPLTRTVVDLRELAAGVAESLRVLAEDNDQALTIEGGPRVTAECDPGVLRMAITNVLHNAITYTPNKGQVRVAARTGGEDAIIEVRDTGPGISAAHRERIFERFYRVDDARSRDAGGVGLGLAIARWAVEANGGRIEVESDEGHGALFRIVLPRS
jgi:heavy metal sensor kinase